MGTICLNRTILNTVRLNHISPKKQGGSTSENNAPDGYARFITEDDMVFTASDGAFFVKL